MILWTLILFIVVIALFILPLMPALIELHSPTDDAPLRVVRENDGNFTHFSDGFRRYIDTNFTSLLAGDSTQSSLKDGTPFQIVGEDQQFNINTGKPVDKLVLSSHALSLPGEALYQEEVYSANHVQCGKGSYLRAVLSEGDVELKEGCTVLRWVHADRGLFVHPQSMLFGRASAGARMVIAAESGFERLQAPRIEFGTIDPNMGHPGVRHDNLTQLDRLQNVKRRFRDRWLVSGKVKIPANTYFKGDIIASGDVEIGHSCKIEGSIKANGDMYIGSNVTVTGSLVCVDEMHIESGCHIHGPVISEDAISIASGTVVGSDIHPTSVNAKWIYIEEGVLVHGTVWATEEGSVEHKNANRRDEDAA